jgi:hypothetical protein
LGPISTIISLTSDNAIFLGQLVGFNAILAGGYQPPK